MPDWKPSIRQRLAKLQLAPTREAAIVEELAQHLDDCYAELLSGGATEGEAYRAALAELRESELLTRELRRVEQQFPPEPIVLGTNRRTNMIADLWQNLRFGARMLLMLFPASSLFEGRSELKSPVNKLILRFVFQRREHADVTSI